MRINKYPFLLWLTEKKDDLQLDLKNLKVSNEELGESSLKPIPMYVVFLIKYLPLVLFLLNFYYPHDLQEFFLFVVAFVITLGLTFAFQYPLIFKLIVIALCGINFYCVFAIEDYAVGLDIALTFFVECILLVIIALDVFFYKAYKNWYYLESFKNEINIRFTQRKEKRLLFFWKKNLGFNTEKKVSLRGYFLRVEDEDIK